MYWNAKVFLSFLCVSLQSPASLEEVTFTYGVLRRVAGK